MSTCLVGGIDGSAYINGF